MRDQTYRTIFSQSDVTKDIWVFGGFTCHCSPFCLNQKAAHVSPALGPHSQMRSLQTTSMEHLQCSTSALLPPAARRESEIYTAGRNLRKSLSPDSCPRAGSLYLCHTWQVLVWPLPKSRMAIPHPPQIFLSVITLTACHFLTSNPSLLLCRLSSLVVLSIIYMANNLFPFSSQPPFEYLTAVTLSCLSLL